MDELEKKTISFKLNISIERFILRVPIFMIMVINVVLITSFEFLVIMAYIGIVLVLVNQFVKDRWVMLGYILQLAIAGVVIAGFINAFVTPRRNSDTIV